MSSSNQTHHHEHSHVHAHHEHSSGVDALKDPVCGMAVTNESRHSYSLKDIMYYFCSNGCKENL